MGCDPVGRPVLLSVGCDVLQHLNEHPLDRIGVTVDEQRRVLQGDPQWKSSLLARHEAYDERRPLGRYQLDLSIRGGRSYVRRSLSQLSRGSRDRSSLVRSDVVQGQRRLPHRRSVSPSTRIVKSASQGMPLRRRSSHPRETSGGHRGRRCCNPPATHGLAALSRPVLGGILAYRNRDTDQAVAAVGHRVTDTRADVGEEDYASHCQPQEDGHNPSPLASPQRPHLNNFDRRVRAPPTSVLPPSCVLPPAQVAHG